MKIYISKTTLFLERLDAVEIHEIVDYYSKNMQDFGVFTNDLPSR